MVLDPVLFTPTSIEWVLPVCCEAWVCPISHIVPPIWNTDIFEWIPKCLRLSTLPLSCMFLQFSTHISIGCRLICLCELCVGILIGLFQNQSTVMFVLTCLSELARLLTTIICIDSHTAYGCKLHSCVCDFEFFGWFLCIGCAPLRKYGRPYLML